MSTAREWCWGVEFVQEVFRNGKLWMTCREQRHAPPVTHQQARANRDKIRRLGMRQPCVSPTHSLVLTFAATLDYFRRFNIGARSICRVHDESHTRITYAVHPSFPLHNFTLNLPRLLSLNFECVIVILVLFYTTLVSTRCNSQP